MSNTIEIEIDGKTFQVEPGEMIIEVADKAGIPIPRFCYHKKLSVAANCRMCLVDVEKVGKPLPACATPVTADMKISTRSARAREAQQAVMEFLLINHPLDCPICDQGGQCELQDVALSYGRDSSRYDQTKRAVADPDLGTLVATELTRCIQCTRCVRFGEEIAGVRELGMVGRGEEEHIATANGEPLRSELSANIIDICPVGALTSKPFAYQARAWELRQHDSIAAHDCMGSNIHVHTRRDKVMRVVPCENEAINETWLSDRDRFSYLACNSEERIGRPLIKKDNKWLETDWSEALNHVADRLSRVASHHGGEQIGGLISPNATLEEAYLWQKLLRSLHCDNIDHRITQLDTSYQDYQPLMPGLNGEIAQLETIKAALLIGSDIRREQPLLNLRLRKAWHNHDASISAINMLDFDFNYPLAHKRIVAPDQFVTQLLGVLKALIPMDDQALPADLQARLSEITVDETHKAMAEQLQSTDSSVLILGPMAQQHPQAGMIHALAQLIASHSNSQLASLTPGANSAGCWLAGCVPHRRALGQAVDKPGLATKAMLDKQLKAYLLFNVEPELDCAEAASAVKALAKADFVVSFSPFKGGILNAHADVILPISPFTENNGTYINCEGRWQHFSAAVKPLAETRPGWKVLRVLANLLKLDGFDYLSAMDVEKILAEQVSSGVNLATMDTPFSIAGNTQATQADKASLQRISHWPMFRVDNVVRRAHALQASAAATPLVVTINAKTAKQHGLSAECARVEVDQNEQTVTLPLMIAEWVPDDCIYMPSGSNKTVKLSSNYGPISLREATVCPDEIKEVS